jgi:uncharacterized protein YjbI with pentapeptide repeats
MSLLELLTSNKITEFNEQRPVRGRVELFAADLANARLSGVNLSGADLSKADLSSAVLEGANLMSTNLEGIDGEEIDFTGAMGHRAKCKDAWLVGAVLDQADFSNARFTDANVSKSKGKSIRFEGAKLNRIDASDAQWLDCDLREAKLHGADFSKADLSRAQLDETRGAEATFDATIFDNSVGRDCRFPESSFLGASMKGVRWEAVNLTKADLTNANLSNSDLSGSNLTDAVLVGVNLTGVNLSDAVLTGADFTDAILTGVDMTGTDPQELNLTTAQIASLSASGAGTAVDSPRRIASVRVALNAEASCALWRNASDTGVETIRWEVTSPKRTVEGVLPVSAQGLNGHFVTATQDEFQITLLIDRPGGLTLCSYGISMAGELRTCPPQKLSYRPQEGALLLNTGTDTTLWGLDSRGSGAHAHRLGLDEMKHVAAIRTNTAEKFCSRWQPILLCKGGVVVHLQVGVKSRPMRTVQGFEGPLACAAELDGKVLLIWLSPPKGKDEPGGLRATWVGGRHATDTIPLSMGLSATTVDVMRVGERVKVVWATSEYNCDDTKVTVMTLPEATRSEFSLSGVDVDEVQWVANSETPGLLITTLEGDVLVCEESGAQRLQLKDEE